MKYLRIFGCALAGLFAALVVIYVAANSVDETLEPGAAAILQEQVPVSDQGTKAFYYLLGIRAGDLKDPEVTGRDLWAKAAALPESDEGAFFHSKLQDRWTSIPFVQHPHEVESTQWKTRKEVRDAFPKAEPEVQQYIRLLEYGEISPLHTRDLYTSASVSPQMMLKGSKWMHVYLGKLVNEKKWKEAERLVRLEANFQKSFWQNQTLLSLMVGTVIMQADARFLDGEKKQDPKLKISPETVSALKMPNPKLLIHESLKSEFRYFAAAMPMIMGHGTNDWLPLESPAFLKRTPVRWVLLPNEAINKYYQFTKEADEKICEDCYSSLQWSNPKYIWEYLRNPLGRKIMWIFTIQLNKRYEALEIKHKEIQDIVRRLSA
jgi:hypothetical protein